METETRTETMFNVTLRFADQDTFVTTIDLNDQLETLVRKGIIYKAKLSADILPEFIPLNICNKFRVIYRGKLYKELQNKMSTISGFENNTVIHCVFPQLTNDEIESIKSNVTVSEQEINNFLTSEEFRNFLKNPTNFNNIKQYIANPTSIIQTPVQNSISQNTVTVDLDVLYEEQIVVLANMGFDNSETIKKLLQKYNGNVQSVLNELLN